MLISEDGGLGFLKHTILPIATQVMSGSLSPETHEAPEIARPVLPATMLISIL
jgi:IMP dehydrogenase/GMP reductase